MKSADQNVAGMDRWIRDFMPVFLVSSDGTRYNMKSADQNVAGMDRWIRDFSHQMEIFTCDLEDEMIMMRYLLNRAA